ncbi:ureidoglycolate lyase [Cupriavidus taiwanensis]|uniref:ureidoglycolate lyase n=1 Tax=Cupriavidus taiwanensis TaxID=164546 RepID=UPI000E10A276|nr:ureidoglycolate lyase [Cupriavidus taiwanensis]SOY50559.1 Ureidoglycolate lyase [Cupriavidus taiwanensis]SOY50828.1 Ureidoglycolate lyase [Cupriavidus taiwanensis]SOY83722.1 Ureidoglycolate lyase [Cupriavidus taiwanensis]SOZ57944.1 Ureidoglycolate lyase [Cupriavidus taiwanensis]SOZ79757.1 Ureidoglycolate lyase [Cupriavidus taiwanensis]
METTLARMAGACMCLHPQPLTAAAFAPFGDVIEARPVGDPNAFPINGGMVMRHHDLATVELGRGRALISLFEARPYAFPMEITMLERHPLGSQAFIPLSDRPFLVVVAPPGDTLEAESVCAFITNGRQGVNYRAGVWHHMLLAVDAPSSFAVVDRGGDGNNCEERCLAQPLLLELPGA